MKNQIDHSINPIDNAYNRVWKVEAWFREYADSFDVDLYNMWDRQPDCKVGHFGYNFYFRTPTGMKSGKYKNWSTLYNGISRTAKSHGLTLYRIDVMEDGKTIIALEGK